jgi:hypothetical protein
MVTVNGALSLELKRSGYRMKRITERVVMAVRATV